MRYNDYKDERRERAWTLLYAPDAGFVSVQRGRFRSKEVGGGKVEEWNGNRRNGKKRNAIRGIIMRERINTRSGGISRHGDRDSDIVHPCLNVGLAIRRPTRHGWDAGRSSTSAPPSRRHGATATQSVLYFLVLFYTAPDPRPPPALTPPPPAPRPDARTSSPPLSLWEGLLVLKLDVQQRADDNESHRGVGHPPPRRCPASARSQNPGRYAHFLDDHDSERGGGGSGAKLFAPDAKLSRSSGKVHRARGDQGRIASDVGAQCETQGVPFARSR